MEREAHHEKRFPRQILQIAAGELSIAGVTPEHPFYDAGRGEWITAGEVKIGTRLLAWLGSADVREIEVTSVRPLPRAGMVEIFNLTIDGPEHNYFAEGLLVHNKEPNIRIIDDDRDGVEVPLDCDDTDPSTSPEDEEDCSDGKDNDCDGFPESRDPDCGGDPCPLPTGVFAMERIFFGETNRDGSLDLDNGWKQYGFDLDWHNTTANSKDVCKALAGGAVVVDGMDARDNSFGKNIVPILREYFPDAPDAVTSAANEAIAAGLSTYLFGVEKSDLAECFNVTTNYYRGSSMASPPVFDGTNVWPLDPAWLKDPSAPSLGSTLVGSGQIVNPDNYQSFLEGPFEIRVDVKGGALVLPIRLAQFVTAAIPDDASAIDGQLGGVIDTEELVKAVIEVATVADPALCDPSGAAYQALADRIRQAADVWVTPTGSIAQNQMHSCNAVSIGIGFSMRRANLGESASPTPPGTDGCGP